MAREQVEAHAGDTLLVAASLARTALDDPDGLHDPPRWDGDLSYSSLVSRDIDLHAYAVARLDEIIEGLDPSTVTRESLAVALTNAGGLVAGILETIDNVMVDAVDADVDAYVWAGSRIATALDCVDEAIEVLRADAAEGE